MFFNKNKKLLEQTLETLQQARTELSEAKDALQKVKSENADLTNKYSSFIEKDKILQGQDNEIEKVKSELIALNEKYQNALKIYSELEQEIDLYKEGLEVGEFGLYEPIFNFNTSEQYRLLLEQNYQKQKYFIKSDQAVICHTQWQVEGSLTEGRKMTAQYTKLMLYAFNGECDSSIAKVKWNNASKIKERIQKAFENINKLGNTHHIEITKEYLDLKLEEFALTYEMEQKVNAEKEEQRRIREQMREEEKAQKELEKAQQEAEEEERRYQKALEKIKKDLGYATPAEVEGLNEQIKSLEAKLKQAQEQKERAMSMAQMTKVGHIYVISNIGSFGEDIYKIGLTRRLDPLDRVKELGDASVPFQFDVHAIIYSENAPQLEYDLHQKLMDKRINRINNRKEFFKTTLDEIEIFVKDHAGAEIQFTKIAEAREYRETLTMLEKLNSTIESESQKKRFPETLI